MALRLDRRYLRRASGATLAQFVKGNEAVKLLPDGSKRVETPPLARHRADPQHQALRGGRQAAMAAAG